jgi:hypothetical protein
MSGSSRTNSAKSRRSRQLKVILAMAAIVISSAGIYAAIRAYMIWSASEHLPASLELPQPPQRPIEEPPWHPVHLNTVHMRPGARRHLLDGKFTVVTRMRDITDPCKEIFESSFIRTFTRSPAPKELINFADPGQDFWWSDAGREGLSQRRLVFAGLGTKSCFIHYERGGGPSYPIGCLAIIDYTQHKTVWVGVYDKNVRNFKTLRKIFVEGHFNDTYGPGC